MQIGEKIRELRNAAGMTQKDLSQQLNVTAQAISRWENDEVEPSIGTLDQMAEIFHVPVDELFGRAAEQKNEEVAETPSAGNTFVPNVPNFQVPKQMLALCTDCNSPIYEKEDIVRISDPRNQNITQVICSSCNAKRVAKKRDEDIAERLLARRRSFVWSGLIAAVVLAVFVAISMNPFEIMGIVVGFVLALAAFTFASCLFLANNFVEDFWESVSSWGFVKMPGIIFSFDFDGIVFLITMKIVLFILSTILAIAAGILATALALVLSIFTYPYAICRNVREVRELRLIG